MPTVLLNRAAVSADVSAQVHTTTVDDAGGAHAATIHLLGLGHRRIGFIAGAAHNAGAGERDARAPSDAELCVRGDFAENGGWHGACALLALAQPPTAIVAANDAMAVGALGALREAGVDVPARMAVIGFDDVPVARFLDPPLASVRAGIAAPGARGARLLLQAVAERPPPGTAPRCEVLPMEIVVHVSCGAPRSASLSPIPVPFPSEDPSR